MENIYVQFGDMVHQQIVGIPMGTNCAPLIANLFLYYFERDFMSNLQKSKPFDLIDKFNDTSRYLDDIFTIDNPGFAEHIPVIYWTPKETLQSSLLNYFIKCDYMAFLHLVKVVRDVFEDKCQIGTRCNEAMLL